MHVNLENILIYLFVYVILFLIIRLSLYIWLFGPLPLLVPVALNIMLFFLITYHILSRYICCDINLMFLLNSSTFANMLKPSLIQRFNPFSVIIGEGGRDTIITIFITFAMKMAFTFVFRALTPLDKMANLSEC